MLSGLYISKLAKARRLLIPKSLRQELGKVFIVSKWYEKSIVLVPFDQWESFVEKVLGPENQIKLAKRDSERFILGSSFKLKQDKQGRVVLPNILILHAKLGNDVVFLGLRNRIELWDKKEWERRENHITTHAGSILESLNTNA